ncbi:unnamed protein product [Mytilus edulis]|uniref:Uncharacterized protein n=1 Tax=Mytilus edulis TaxID=6550 RepID=A0A8S3TSE7_MYTED|nr:unnamed protein product [Mytilus edulis]
MMLSRGICVFDIDQSGCKKLLVTMSTDTIAIQLMSFSTRKPDLESICVSIREDLIEKIKAIKERYKLALSYELHFKCSTGKYYDQTISYKTLKCSPEYQCKEHQEAHQSEEIYLPWMMNTEEDMWKRMSAMVIELTNAANRYENLGVSMENLVEEEEPKPESNINQQAKTVDDNFKKATAEKTSSIAGENNIATMSQEDENYVRMSLLLYSISPRAVRKLFDSEFNPTVLDATFQKAYSKLKDLRIKE